MLDLRHVIGIVGKLALVPAPTDSEFQLINICTLTPVAAARILLRRGRSVAMHGALVLHMLGESS